MAAEMQRTKSETSPGGQIEYEVQWKMASPVPIAGGFAIWPEFEVISTFTEKGRDPIGINVLVEVSKERARAKRVSVEREDGVSSTTLRGVPIRDVVATGVRRVLMRVELSSTGKGAKMTPVAEDFGPTELEAVKRIVGYIEEVKR